MSDQKQRPTVAQAVLSALSKVDANGLRGHGGRPAPPDLETPGPAAETPVGKPTPKEYLNNYLRRVISR